MDTVVTPFQSADDPATEQAYTIVAAAQAADVPDFPPLCWQSFRGGFTHPWPNRPTQHFLARVDGVPAGYLKVVLPDLDNTENAFMELIVHPQHRRRGVGRTLYEHGVAVARQEGRKKLMGDTLTGSPGDQFALSVGAKSAQVDARRRLDLAGLDEADLDRQLTEAWQHAAGYSLVRWRNEVPDEYVDDLAYLDGRFFKDAPMGDLAWQPEQVDAARIRAAEAALQGRRERRYDSGVRHDATGRLVAWTSIGVEDCTPEHAWQQITIVDPRHRGHRLGLLVKIENLRHARAHEPDVRIIDTWNAAENAHMIAINEQLGFRLVDTWTAWQLDL